MELVAYLRTNFMPRVAWSNSQTLEDIKVLSFGEMLKGDGKGGANNVGACGHSGWVTWVTL